MKLYIVLNGMCCIALDSISKERPGISIAFIFVSLCLPVKCEHLSQKIDFFKNFKINLPFIWKDNDIYRIDDG